MEEIFYFSSVIFFEKCKDVEEFHRIADHIHLQDPLVPLIPEHPVNYLKELSPNNIPDLAKILANINSSPRHHGSVVLEINYSSSTTAYLQRLNRGTNNAIQFLPSYRNIANSIKYISQILAQLYPFPY